MLQEEALHQDGHKQPPPVARQAQRQAEQCERWRQRLDPALDVPLFVQLAETSLDGASARCRDLAHVFFRVLPDLGIDSRVGVAADPIGCAGNHGYTPLENSHGRRGASLMPQTATPFCHSMILPSSETVNSTSFLSAVSMITSKWSRVSFLSFTTRISLTSLIVLFGYLDLIALTAAAGRSFTATSF